MRLLFLLKKHFLITWADERGAVVTHGGVLPDSSQKTDFYSIIDNATVSSIVSADISASAGIMDSQLNTISSANKVNVSALTGQIANANLAQIVNPALVSGAALTLLPNIPSGAGFVPVANISGLLGAWVSKTIGTTYQALTDGLVIASATSASTVCQLEVLTDSSSTPVTIRANSSSAQGQPCGVCCPVRKNDYYEVFEAQGSTLSNTDMYFIPLGS